MSSDIQEPAFQSLDFLYTPSRDVAADADYFSGVLGGRIVFAIEAMGTRVAMIDVTGGSPRILLAGHLEGERPILVYRVSDLEEALESLASRGWSREHAFEIPHGPCCSSTLPAGTGSRFTSSPGPKSKTTSKAAVTSRATSDEFSPRRVS